MSVISCFTEMIACIWWWVGGEGRSSTEAVSHPTHRPSAFIPSAEKKGHSLQTDGKTEVTLHYVCVTHQFMLLLPWPEKVKYSSILKKTQAANNNNASLLEHFVKLLHCSCSSGCSVSGSRENCNVRRPRLRSMKDRRTNAQRETCSWWSLLHSEH